MTEVAFDELPYTDVIFASDAVHTDRERGYRDSMQHAAFTAFLSGAGAKGQSFDQFCTKLGLKKKEPPLPSENKKMIIESAIERVNRIIAADKARKA